MSAANRTASDNPLSPASQTSQYGTDITGRSLTPVEPQRKHSTEWWDLDARRHRARTEAQSGGREIYHLTKAIGSAPLAGLHRRDS